MAHPPLWLRVSRSLPVLLGIVVGLPAAALIVLGVRILDQDRALATQRRAELAESAADRAVGALEHELAAVSERLADPAWTTSAPPDGVLHAMVTSAGLLAEPATAVAWFPAAAPLPAPPSGVFAAADAAEFRASDFAGALALNTAAASQPNAAIRAGALVRQARLLRKLNRPDEADAVYGLLAGLRGVAIEGTPADLVAWQAQCALAAARGDAGRLRTMARRLQAELHAGRWRIDHPTHQYVIGRLGAWLGAEATRDPGREALATALDWLGHLDVGRRASGSRLIECSGTTVVAVWVASPGRIAATLALPTFVNRMWRLAATRAASPAEVDLLAAESRAAVATTGGGAAVASRPAAATGLPWTVVARVAPGVEAPALAARTRLLFGGLAAVLVLAFAGASLVLRARRQELALARLQSDFVAAVSHEFRTPLTTLSQFNELLEDDGLPGERRRVYHDAQARATERLRRLVESLLDFGRTEAGRRPYTVVGIEAAALVNQVVDDFRSEVEGRGFVVRWAAEPGAHVIRADGEALGRAVWNLLDNAAKYSGDSRVIDVHVGASTSPHAAGAGRVAIAIRDFGLGIPRSEQTRVFQKFVRGEAALAAGIKGTGIGLTMARHIVAAHGGRLLLQSEPGHGSTFTIELPREPA